jgi:type I restriction enzyme S subunit
MHTTDALDSSSSTAHPRYDEYEESGVDWLGEIPAHWEVVPFRYYCDIPKGKVDPKSEEHQDRTLIGPNHVEQDTGNIRELETAADQGASSDKYLVEPGDLIYSKIRPELNKVCIAEGRWLCSADMYPIKIRKGYNTRFLKYLMLSRQFVRLMVNDSMRVAMPKVNRDTLEAARVLLPSLDEQRAIAAYLDRETERIDALIEKKEQLIDLLEEKRKSLISRVVTKGLDDDVEMKDSGVEWLGEIPAGWDVVRLKFLTEVQSGIAKGKRYGDDVETVELPYLRVANVQEGFLNLDEISEIEVAVDEVDRYLLQAGDVLMTEGGDYDKLGRGTVWTGNIEPCLHQNHIFAVRPHSIESEWVALITQAQYAKHFFIMQSVQSTNLASISRSSLQDLPVVVPPPGSRQVILDHVDRETERIDVLIDKIETAIDRLKEYRTALISAAVTGQIDVRGERETDKVKKVDTGHA